MMRHSGMRIGDTIALDEKRLKGNRLLLYTPKTGTPRLRAPESRKVAALTKKARPVQCSKWNEIRAEIT